MKICLPSTAAAVVLLSLVVACSPSPAPPEATKPVAEAASPPPADTPAGAAAEGANASNEAKAIDKLIVWADADPDEGEAPLSTQLTAEPLEEIDTPTYTWDFGDGSARVTEQNPKHTYVRPGDYTARLRVTDVHGNAGEDEVMITVDPPQAPPADSGAPPAPGSAT